MSMFTLHIAILYLKVEQKQVSEYIHRKDIELLFKSNEYQFITTNYSQMCVITYTNY